MQVQVWPIMCVVYLFWGGGFKTRTGIFQYVYTKNVGITFDGMRYFHDVNSIIKKILKALIWYTV